MVDPVWYETPAELWGVPIAVYLFLGGLSGGAYITSVVADYLSSDGGKLEESYATTARWGAAISFAGMAVGGPLLLSHLGRPVAAAKLWNFTNADSWMSLGVWIIFAFTAFAALQILWLWFGNSHRREGVAVLLRAVDRVADASRPPEKVLYGIYVAGVAAAVTVMAYTAFLLSAASPFIPAWHPILLPLLFITSGISIGVGATVAITAYKQGVVETCVRRFSIADDAVIAAEIVVMAVLIYVLATGTGAARVSYENIMGEYGFVFWGGFVAIGLVIPVVLSVALFAYEKYRSAAIWREHSGGDTVVGSNLQKRLRWGYITKFSLVVFGGLALRYVVLFVAVGEPTIG